MHTFYDSIIGFSILLCPLFSSSGTPHGRLWEKSLLSEKKDAIDLPGLHPNSIVL